MIMASSSGVKHKVLLILKKKYTENIWRKQKKNADELGIH